MTTNPLEISVKAATEAGTPIVRCSTCGMVANVDPDLHYDRYLHFPTVRCLSCKSDIPFGGPSICDRCDEHGISVALCGSCGREVAGCNPRTLAPGEVPICRDCGFDAMAAKHGADWDASR